MEVIRTTGLWSFWTCWFKYKNDEYKPDPKNTYHGDLLNIWVTWRGDYEPLLQYYVDNINPDLGFKFNLWILMGKARKFIEQELAKDQWVYQEAKMYLKRDADLWIEGVPDVYTVHQADEEWIEVDCYDLKCSTWSWYTGDEMWDLNLQTYIYPLMIMNVYKKDVCRFSYLIGDKNNGKMKMESRIRTREECETLLKDVVSKYKEAQLLEKYDTRKNKLCSFCSLKSSCPQWNATYTTVDEVVSLFD